MVNYKNGKIYKLVCGDLVYIGSTTTDLRKRFHNHKKDYNKQKYKTSSFKLFDYADNNGLNVDIVLIEKYACEDKSELHRRERYWIENIDCVNKVMPTRTKKEYYEKNKDKIIEYQKEYREQYKDKLKEKRKEYYNKNKDKIRERNKKYIEKNKDKMREHMKEYNEQNKDKIKRQKREYYEKNKDKILQKQKERYEKNKI